MVSYKLSILNKKEVIVIKLDELIKIKELRVLDEFTSNFTNEDELKMYLYKKSLLKEEELNKDIRITYKNNEKIKKLPVLYKNLQKYRDIVYLRNKLIALAKQQEFLIKLADHYSGCDIKYNRQGQNVYDIRLYLSGVLDNGSNIFEYELLSTALDNLFEKAIIKSINKKGEILINYRGQRDLIFFIDEYEKSLKKETKSNEENWVQGTLYGIAQNNLNYNIQEEDVSYEYKSKLSSDGDPDFPYNSEEEEMYNNYLENLPDEYHPHRR